MLIAMAVLGLTTYTLLLTSPQLLHSLASSSPSNQAPGSPPHSCSDAERHNILRQLPECIPRNTLVKLPLPSDPNIILVRLCHNIYLSVES